MPDVRTVISSPIGRLLVASHRDAICEICFQRQIPAWEETNEVASHTGVIRTAIEQLDAYFCGKLRNFDLPLHPPTHRSARAHQVKKPSIDAPPNRADSAASSNPVPDCSGRPFFGTLSECRITYGKMGPITNRMR